MALQSLKVRAGVLLTTIAFLFVPIRAGWAMAPIPSHDETSNCGTDCQVLAAVAQKFSPDAKAAVLSASPDVPVDMEVSRFWKDSWIGHAPSAELVHAWSKANHNSVVSTCAAGLQTEGYTVSHDAPLSFTGGPLTDNRTRAVEISSPSYNKKRDEALVYAVEICNGLCGLDEYIFLTKTAGKWTISGERPTVIS